MRHAGRSFLARVMIATFTVVMFSLLVSASVVARMNIRQHIENDQTAIMNSFSTVSDSISSLLDESALAFTSLQTKQEISEYIFGRFHSKLEQVQAKQRFDDQMENLFLSNGHITDLLFIDADGTVSGSSLDWHYTGDPQRNNPFFENAYTAGYDTAATNWYDCIPATNLLPSEAFRYRTSGYRICGASRFLYTFSGSAVKQNIVTVIAIDEKAVRNRYSFLAEPGSNVYIINSDGKCLSSTDPDCITKAMPWSSAIPEAESGTFRFEDDTEKAFQFFYKRFPFSGWIVIKKVPSSIYSVASVRLYKTTLLVAAIVLLLITPILAIWIRGIFRPLRHLTDTMAAVRDGRLDTRISIREKDPPEVRIVAEQTNEMLDSLTDLLVHNEENEQHKHHLEMQTLQSQITPHFMFNTLSSIRWMAQMSGYEDISHMLHLFSQLLHPVYSDWSEKWTLQEELEFTRNYIELIHIRYSGKVQISIDPDLPSLDHMIPRFTLQPVLENSCEHAVRPDRDLHVHISIMETYGELLIHTEDDGTGMTPEVYSRLQSILDSDFEPCRGENGHRSIGLYNIHKRLQLLYGNGYGICVRSVYGTGTTVDIRIGG